MRNLALPVSLLLLASCATPQQGPSPQIAITIDDLPVHAPYPPGVTANQVNAQIVAALIAGHVPATGFLNGVGVEQHPETMQALMQWRNAGLVVGNHTWSHPHLSEMTAAQFEKEVDRNEPILRQIGGETDWSSARLCGPNSSRPSTRLGLTVDTALLGSSWGWPIPRDATTFKVACEKPAVAAQKMRTKTRRLFDTIKVSRGATRSTL